MGYCPKCNNNLIKDNPCSYCVWKGDIGPGKELRDIIKRSPVADIKHRMLEERAVRFSVPPQQLPDSVLDERESDEVKDHGQSSLSNKTSDL